MLIVNLDNKCNRSKCSKSDVAKNVWPWHQTPGGERKVDQEYDKYMNRMEYVLLSYSPPPFRRFVNESERRKGKGNVMQHTYGDKDTLIGYKQ